MRASTRLIGVLEVRQEDVDLAAQGLDCLLCLIGAGVVDDGQVEALLPGHLECMQDLRHIVRRRHEVERRRAARLLLEENRREPFIRDFIAEALMRDLVILTEAATQVAVREEDRARTAPVRAREARLLPLVQGDERDARLRPGTAEAHPLRAVDAAMARAELAVFQ